MKQFRVTIQKALGWTLNDLSLRQEITDRAEEALGLQEEEGTIEVTVEGENFVATFIPA